MYRRHMADRVAHEQAEEGDTKRAGYRLAVAGRQQRHGWARDGEARVREQPGSGCEDASCSRHVYDGVPRRSRNKEMLQQ